MQTRVEQKPSTTKRMIVMIVAVVALIALIAGIKVLSIMKMIAGSKPPPPAVVSTAKATYQEWQPELRAVGTLRANPDLKLTIEGHCDSMGTSEYNLALGNRRANTARDYLVSRGIDASRFTTISYGEERPKADNSTPEGRAMNRRAALVVKIQ